MQRACAVAVVLHEHEVPDLNNLRVALVHEQKPVYLGSLLLGSSSLTRTFGRGDLRVAEALAERGAMAIENARLYRSAVAAIQLRDQVLGVVAHDLRNPLSAILMQTPALVNRGLQLERRSLEPLQVINRAATRMNRLIQDLLDVTRMEAGRLTIEQARLSASALIAEAVDTQRPLAKSSSIELRVNVDPAVPDVWGDWNRLFQVFENLIGNAIKFTQPGGRIHGRRDSTGPRRCLPGCRYGEWYPVRAPAPRL